MYRHHPQTLKVKEMLDTGVIGDLCLIRGSFTFNLKRKDDVRLDLALGGGSVWDVGCYPISYSRAMIGEEPVEVFGWQWTGPSGVDEVFIGQIRFAGNVLAQFDCGFRGLFRATMEIVGTSGAIFIPNPFKPGKKEKIILTRDEEKKIIQINGPELYSGEVEDLADAVLLGRAPRISLEDSAGNLATILALYQSAKENRPISI